jgi:hypothetical protein
LGDGKERTILVVTHGNLLDCLGRIAPQAQHAVLTESPA